MSVSGNTNSIQVGLNPRRTDRPNSRQFFIAADRKRGDRGDYSPFLLV
ncbi:MAG UNVERIFIED_CONTAM: hypothetical protein LVR29_28775 [Microcystis novacekii LVE1205-3]